MLARRLTTILPEMTLAEALDTTRMHRVTGCTAGRTAVVTSRPCRAPHHTIAEVGRIGGAQLPVPGRSPWRTLVSYSGMISPSAPALCSRAGDHRSRRAWHEDHGPHVPHLTPGARSPRVCHT